ncbi:nuclear factor NF-kappa-B p105 subunit isoform X2 [Musca domestica]|uniref:Nuclear factor NF-kappa-B p105 subunit isoform X2 n=1 Tax=Musca domestica TaxID=7370 RepID=A0A1I8NJK9_MUSDO|nr:nuclear factor NF-kappa-B p105 subunit isoform X2 [Musca domestica]
MADSDETLNQQLKVAFKNFACDMILVGRNARRENLLHYACQHNLHFLIEPFVMQGYALCQQDIEGHTALHVAIIKGHDNCLKEFLRLFERCKCLHEDHPLKRNIVRLFFIYSHRGYTVLHEAVRDRGNIPFPYIRGMLEFALELQLDFQDMEILGSGDTLLHLIVQHNRLELAQIVCQRIPELLERPNYAGTVPMDVARITPEMQSLLKNAIYTGRK